jgi:hypothetical protein
VSVPAAHRHAAATGPADVERTSGRWWRRQLVVREFAASALYVATVLLTEMVAIPRSQLPSDRAVVGILVGTAVGLTLAHWLAFRLASQLTTHRGAWEQSAGEEGLAQFAGAGAIAVLGALPFLVLDGTAAYRTALLVLAVQPAAAGTAIARMRGTRWLRAFAAGALVLAATLLVVTVKILLDH